MTSPPAGGRADGARVPSDLPGREVAGALQVLDAATRRLLAAARTPGAQPALWGWDREMLLSHLTYGARASARMTADALAGRPTSFYPGGAAEREASLLVGSGADDGLVDELERASAELHQAWLALAAADFDRPLPDPKFPGATLARLVVLRLTETEVHGGDLSGGPDSWSEEFVRIALPLRVAWLPTHHRARADAAHDIVGEWRLVSGEEQWRVTATPGGATVSRATSRSAGVPVLSAGARHLLAFLLGRTDPSAHPVGDPVAAERFRRAFPGP